MKNVEMKVEKDVLVIRVNLKKDFGPSKSRKSVIIASTEGNRVVDGTNTIVGLNVYRKA